MEEIKLIIFDLDDCLIDTWGASFPITLEKAISKMVEAGLKINSFGKHVKKLEEINNYSVNTSEAIKRYLEEINEDVGKYLEIGKSAVYDYSFKEGIKPNKGVIEMLEKLTSVKIDIALVTKGGKESQMTKILNSGIRIDKFKKVSIVDNYDKTEAYQEVLEELGYLSENTLIIGDRYKTDLIPGKNLGAKVAWIPRGRGRINAPTKDEVDYIIEDFNEIEKIIRG